jgi:hypothetical protein
MALYGSPRARWRRWRWGGSSLDGSRPCYSLKVRKCLGPLHSTALTAIKVSHLCSTNAHSSRQAAFGRIRPGAGVAGAAIPAPFFNEAKGWRERRAVGRAERARRWGYTAAANSWLSGVCCLRQGEAVGHSDGGGEEVDALQLWCALWAGGPDGMAQALPGLTLIEVGQSDDREDVLFAINDFM